MNLLKAGKCFGFPVLVLTAILLVPVFVFAQEFKVFHSEEYGFSMRYPATWKKIDKPKGNYYLVFQAPELTDNFRNRVHVAAHKPVKDPLKVFLQELRNGIKDLQGKAGGSGQKEVRILDEGEFNCDVPGAYYFFIQAYENKLKLWMDIVIVFYKNQDTLLRISCLAPSSVMEKFHNVFNEVLISVKFDAAAPAPRAGTPPARVAPAPEQPQPAPSPAEPSASQPEARPAPETTTPSAEPSSPPSGEVQPPPTSQPPSAGPTRPGPRSMPLRRTEPPTGIVR